MEQLTLPTTCSHMALSSFFYIQHHLRAQAQAQDRRKVENPSYPSTPPNPSNRATMSPASKFIGRPSRPCPKCRGQWHWVNTMGGLECVTCRPAPASITDIESRLLVAGDGGRGTWQVPGDFDVHPDAQAARENQANGAPAITGKTGASLEDLLDVFDDAASIHGGALRTSERVGRWDAQQQALVDWWMESTKPGSATLHSITESLQGQRLTAWLAVPDAAQLISQLRSDCEIGPNGPRELYGCLTQELRGLRDWIDGRGENNTAVSVIEAENETLDLSDIEI